MVKEIVDFGHLHEAQRGGVLVLHLGVDSGDFKHDLLDLRGHHRLPIDFLRRQQETQRGVDDKVSVLVFEDLQIELELA